MKAYVQFLSNDTTGKIHEELGSDGVYILDGRNNLETWKCDAIERMHRLRFVKPYLKGYRIYRGSRFDNSHMIHESITA